MQWIYFLGRFHVLALHVPIGIILAVVVLEFAARRPRFAHLGEAANFLWGAAAIAAIGTAALGYMHFSEGGFDGSSAYWHRALGTSVAIATTAIWAIRMRFRLFYGKAQPLLGVALVMLVSATGHFGGNLTHGDTYLVKYAPGPVRSLMGLENTRPPVTDIAKADPYLDVVAPMFAQRCSSCHNDDKRRGGLNLSRYETLMKGGKDGAVITAGKPENSDLYRRISLSHDAEEFMPKEGKTPLTPDQVAVVKWWIATGAKTKTTVEALRPAADIRSLLAKELALGTGGTAAAKVEARPADPKLVAQLAQGGFEARAVSISDPHLILNPVAFKRVVGASEVSTLVPFAEQIVELSLPHAGLRDDALTGIGKLTSLRSLRIPMNDIADSGIAALAPLSNLEYLDVHGNPKITDQSLDVLGHLPKLKRLYLWQTRVTPAGVAKLSQLRGNLQINTGLVEGAAASGNTVAQAKSSK